MFVKALFAVAAIDVALPMSFPFRQLISVGGVTILELFLVPVLLALLASRPRAVFPGGYKTICVLLYAFLVWVVGRGLIGIMEGNEMVRALRDMRHYTPFLTLPVLLYLLNLWRPDPMKLLARLTRLLVVAYFVYMLFLVAVIVSPAMSRVLMIDTFVYRVSSHTLAISMSLLLLAFMLWLEKRVGVVVVALALISVGVTLLLAQARVSTVMLVGLTGLAVCLYTARTARTRFVRIGLGMLFAVLLTGTGGFLLLNSVVPDFDKFGRLFLERVERDQAGEGIWDSITTHSFGTEAYRTRLVNEASTRPLVGFGEGAGVGQTSSQDEGAYIDSTAITMWYKNGIIGVLLFYAFWLAVLARLIGGYLRDATRVMAGIASIATSSVLGVAPVERGQRIPHVRMGVVPNIGARRRVALRVAAALGSRCLGGHDVRSRTTAPLGC